MVNDTAGPVTARVHTVIFPTGATGVSSAPLANAPAVSVTVDGGGRGSVEQDLHIAAPQLWSPAAPNL